MILNRIGNKTRVFDKILPYFPRHDVYIEPFFGAGGMFFNKPKARYNIVNDIDGEVFNFFNVIRYKKKQFEEQLKKSPYSEDLWNHWQQNTETDAVMKAVRFLFLSNFGYMGKSETLRFGINNHKKDALAKIEATHNAIQDVQFMNVDFRKVLKKIAFKDMGDKSKYFIYADPPYLNTTDNYSHSFKEEDFIDLLNLLQADSIKFAISEFDTPFVVEETVKRGLNIFNIDERRNMKNRRTEILITNYLNNNTLF